ncbi:hypothetical protein FS837_013028 [Tulasnella sp. UAMH 9824]|nr:hypothetical protein FS837_013028 [Tulasnella sp. UAMH 9824]
MSNYLFLDGAGWDSVTSETAQKPISGRIGPNKSYGDSRGSSSAPLRILNGQPILPAELLIEIVEQLATPQDQTGSFLDKGSLKTLCFLALLSEAFNGLVTPILYRRVRLVTPSAIRSFRRTLSYPPRGTYLSNFVKYFLAHDPMDEATSCIPAIISLIRDSVECVHIDKWPRGSPASELRDCIASIQYLRQLSVNHRAGTVSPTFHFKNRSILDSVVLDHSNVVGMIQGIIDDASSESKTIVGPNFSIYCVAPERMPVYWVVLTVEGLFRRFKATGRDLPRFRIIMFFIETSIIPQDLWASNQVLTPDRWYCLPVPYSIQKLNGLDFHQWLCRSVEDGSLWDIDLIPMGEWATWVKNKFPPEQDHAQGDARRTDMKISVFKHLCLGGFQRDTGTDGRASEPAQQPAPDNNMSGPHYADCCCSISLRISDGQPTLPAELLIEIVEQLAIPPIQCGFRLRKGSLNTLVALAMLNKAFNQLVTPILYRRIRLVTPSAIRSFWSALSEPTRGKILSSFVKYFFAYDIMGKAVGYIPGIITLLQDSLEYVHIDEWPYGSLALELRDCIASIRNLRQLSIGQRGGATSPTIHFSNRSVLQSVVLDETNVLGMVHGILSDYSNGVDTVVGPDLSIYCVASGIITPYYVCRVVEERCEKFLATGRDLPPFRLIMFFIETSTIPAHLLASDLLRLPDRWYCLPVPSSFQSLGNLEFRQWLRRRVEDGSLWDLDPIPISEWTTRVVEKLQPRQDDAQVVPSVITEPQAPPTENEPIIGGRSFLTSMTEFFGFLP